MFNLVHTMYIVHVVECVGCHVPRSRNDSLNILVDLLPPDAPSSNRENTLITVDINRHKEVIVKAISATLLLLLKHFKVCVCVCAVCGGVLCVGACCVCVGMLFVCVGVLWIYICLHFIIYRYANIEHSFCWC